MGTAQIAARFLKAEHERVRAVLFPFLDLFADEFEPDGRFKERDPEIGADGLGHARGHERLDDRCIGGQCVFLFQAGQDIVK